MIKKFVKKGKVYPGVAYIVSKKIESGFVRQTGGLCKFIFGDRENPSNKVLKEIEEIMKDSGIDATFSEDIESHLWKKYIFINAMTGLTALSRTKVGTVVSDPFLRKLYERCLKECVKVAKAEKVNLPYDIFNSIIKISEDTSKEAKFSMLVDIENGRKTEIEALNGTLVRLAKKHKIDVPINETSVLYITRNRPHPRICTTAKITPLIVCPVIDIAIAITAATSITISQNALINGRTKVNEMPQATVANSIGLDDSSQRNAPKTLSKVKS